jgi:hypothetical protein
MWRVDPSLAYFERTFSYKFEIAVDCRVSGNIEVASTEKRAKIDFLRVLMVHRSNLALLWIILKIGSRGCLIIEASNLIRGAN